MNRIHRHWKLVAVGASCAALGAGVSAIASAGAATTSSPAPHGTTRPGTASRLGVQARLRRVLLTRAVHGDVLVATKSGFETITFDRGVVQSVNGQQLTLTEGTKKTVTRTVTLTIPTNAKVRDNGKAASLSAVTTGQRALVVEAPNHTWVVARTPRTR